jgi:hypothetical protein
VEELIQNDVADQQVKHFNPKLAYANDLFIAIGYPF